jgi:hypothetical protein
MNAFSVMGPNAASWKPVEGKHPIIFGVDDNLDCHTMTGADISGGPGSTAQGGNMLLNADLAAATNALRNVTITKATLLQSYNTFGVPLGVSVSCLPKNEVVDTGESPFLCFCDELQQGVVGMHLYTRLRTFEAILSPHHCCFACLQATSTPLRPSPTRP